jgi:dethiobiotin synthetase
VTATFVTGTGTDVGKTFITAALIRHARATGRAVEAFKPVLSGFNPAGAATSDAGVLLAALGRPVTDDTIDRMSPWRFAAPLSPDLAAAREGRAVDFGAVVEFSRRAAAGRDLVLIEGVGGVMVPLDASHTVLDWMSELRAPVLLVAGSYLGTISHTLTALRVLAQRNLDIAAVVISESHSPGATLEETVAAITRFAGTLPSPATGGGKERSLDVIGVPRLSADAASHPAIARIAGLIHVASTDRGTCS